MKKIVSLVMCLIMLAGIFISLKIYKDKSEN